MNVPMVENLNSLNAQNMDESRFEISEQWNQYQIMVEIKKNLNRCNRVCVFILVLSERIKYVENILYGLCIF